MVAAAFASDVRGLIQRYRPPEIVALRGRWFFVASQIQTSLQAGMLIGLPLLLMLLAKPSAATVLLYIAFQTAGTGLGLLASTIFVPQAGELAMQLFAALAPTIALSGILHYGRLASLPPLWQAGAWLAIGAGCMALILLIEIIRGVRHVGTRS